MTDTSHSNQRDNSSVAAPLLRLFWMFFGNIVLAASALFIVQTSASFSLVDILYWLAVLLLVGARYLDISWFKGDTAYGEPATMAHWRRYAFGLLLLAAATWIALHGVVYWLAR